jgi:hypothetical protein
MGTGMEHSATDAWMATLDPSALIHAELGAAVVTVHRLAHTVSTESAAFVQRMSSSEIGPAAIAPSATLAILERRAPACATAMFATNPLCALATAHAAKAAKAQVFARVTLDISLMETIRACHVRPDFMVRNAICAVAQSSTIPSAAALGCATTPCPAMAHARVPLAVEASIARVTAQRLSSQVSITRAAMAPVSARVIARVPATGLVGTPQARAMYVALVTMGNYANTSVQSHAFTVSAATASMEPVRVCVIKATGARRVPRCASG